MPVSNDLISDSDANIMAIVSEWLGKANVATSNAKILAIVKAKSQQAIAGIAGIKQIVNVTLGQAYKGNAKIYTNDDGLNYLDTLVDANKRPLLNPDPTDSAKLQLRCGTVVVPIKVLPNKVLASEGTKVPVIIGDLKAGIRKWDRQSMSVKASDVATIGDFNAFAMNMTLLRAILRDDYTEMDSDAYVYGYIDTAAQGN
jgi:HK97 family phage major capsid protein